MLLKAGVCIKSLNYEIRRSLTLIHAWAEGLNEEMVVLSTNEGEHKAGALHYCNDAYDIRRPERADGDEAQRVRKLLGQDFEVTMYVDVMHIAYNPNRYDGNRRL